MANSAYSRLVVGFSHSLLREHDAISIWVLRGLMITNLFPGFRQQRIDVSGTSIHALIGGKGPPLLLLHGWPQSSLEWHHIASPLAN
jgi:hypothetical protein